MSARPVASPDYWARHNRAMRATSALTQLIGAAYGLNADDVAVYDDADDAESVERDLHGIDAELQFPRGSTLTVSFRTRPQHEWKTDLPIRATSRSGTPSEWYRWQGILNGSDVTGEIPDLIVYGLLSGGCVDDCWLIDTHDLLEVVYEEPSAYAEWPSTTIAGGGVEGSARYIPLEEALDAACIKTLTTASDGDSDITSEDQ